MYLNGYEPSVKKRPSLRAKPLRREGPITLEHHQTRSSHRDRSAQLPQLLQQDQNLCVMPTIAASWWLFDENDDPLKSATALLPVESTPDAVSKKPIA